MTLMTARLNPLVSPAARRALTLAAALTATLVVTPGAHAVQPQRFTHATESDFADGNAEGMVVTNLGDLKLASDHAAMGEMPEGVSFVYDVVEDGGVAYAAVGPELGVVAWRNGAWETVEGFGEEGMQVFALDLYNGTLFVGVSGDAPAIWEYRTVGGGGESRKVIDLPDETRYVWDLLARPDGWLAATGPEGMIYHVTRDRQTVTTVLDTAQANVLCLAEGRGRWAGQVFAGTDTDGLIYRIDETGRPFIVYDAAEPEVGALAVAADGTLYAGTADAEQARPGRLAGAAEEESGRPEGDTEQVLEEAEDNGTDLPDIPPAPVDLDRPVGPPVADAGPAEVAIPEADAGTEAAEASVSDADEATQVPAADDGESDEGEAVMEDAAPDYDALRTEVRRRLAQAAESGTMSSGSGVSARPTRSARVNAAATPAGGAAEGNAVYRIDTEGFVRQVFRESVMVLALALVDEDDALLVGTGNEGQLYRVDLAGGDTTVLADLEPQQLLALRLAADGSVGVGTANGAEVIRLDGERSVRGTYESQALDAGQVSLWGTLRLQATLREGAELALETRSGNVADPEIAQGAGWSDWSEAVPFEADDATGPAPLEAKIDAPPARFLQYRLSLDGSGAADRGALSINRLSIAYITPNEAPRVTSLKAAYPAFPGVDKPAVPTLKVEWEAQDPNEDRLRYTLEYRPANSAGDGPWLGLKADDTETSFDWDTRRVPDGYYDLRVRAGDGLDNPGDMARTAARRVDPVLVDNTPPTIGDLAIAVSDRSAVVTAVSTDALSPLHSVAYRLDDAEDESPLLPDDLIYDSTREAWSITLSDLSPGPHMLSVRVTDLRGNRTFASQAFVVE